MTVRRRPTREQAMKTIWKGASSFGLVTILVKVYGATEEKTLKFNQIHAPDGGRIRYKRVCSIDGEEVPYGEIVKGYEYEKDHYVMLTDEELELRPQEIKMARSLIDSLTDDFEPKEFHDEYRAALEDLISKKVQGEEVTYAEPAEPSKVVDLMDALRASVEAAQSSEPVPTDGHGPPGARGDCPHERPEVRDGRWGRVR